MLQALGLIRMADCAEAAMPVSMARPAASSKAAISKGICAPMLCACVLRSAAWVLASMATVAP
jgi:hypothetical protein